MSQHLNIRIVLASTSGLEYKQKQITFLLLLLLLLSNIGNNPGVGIQLMMWEAEI